MDQIWVGMFLRSLMASIKNSPGWFYNSFIQTAYHFIISPGQVFWTAISTISTLFLAVVALWKEHIYRQPDLILEAENMSGAYVPLRIPNGNMLHSYYYHLRVRNLKPEVLAKNVRVLFRKIDFSTPQTVTRELHPPRQLTWAPAELGEVAPSFLREKTVDVIRVLSGRAEVVVLTAAFTGEHIIPWGHNATILLDVVADNFSKPKLYELICLWTTQNPPNNFGPGAPGYLDLQLRKARL